MHGSDVQSNAGKLTMPIDPRRDHVLGPADAPLTLVEYGDYECPSCGRAYPLLRQLNERFANGLRFVFRHFPVYTIHHHASQAAQAAEAAAAQDKFWPMHDLLYRNQERLESPDLVHYALLAGLEVYQFESTLGSGRFSAHVEADYASGVASGVTGTPTLFLNGQRYQGKIELDALAGEVERRLRDAQQPSA